MKITYKVVIFIINQSVSTVKPSKYGGISLFERLKLNEMFTLWNDVYYITKKIKLINKFFKNIKKKNKKNIRFLFLLNPLKTYLHFVHVYIPIPTLVILIYLLVCLIYLLILICLLGDSK